MTIVKKEKVNGLHPIKTNHLKAVPDGWLAVTPNLESAIWATHGYCDLVVEKGVLVGIVPTEQPALDLPVLKTTQIADLSTACNATIIAGSDVQLSTGAEHFGYALEDQINIAEMFTAITLGATSYPYQATDGSCRIYQAADIVAIYTTLAALKTATLTYYHALKDYVAAQEDADAVQAVTWGQSLEGDYLTHYNATIAAAQEQMQGILARIGGADATTG